MKTGLGFEPIFSILGAATPVSFMLSNLPLGDLNQVLRSNTPIATISFKINNLFLLSARRAYHPPFYIKIE
jgi:hypothetical protein